METIGDCYMVAGGLIRRDEEGFPSVHDGAVDPLHAVRVMSFAKVGGSGGRVRPRMDAKLCDRGARRRHPPKHKADEPRRLTLLLAMPLTLLPT